MAVRLTSARSLGLVIRILHGFCSLESTEYRFSRASNRTSPKYMFFFYLSGSCPESVQFPGGGWLGAKDRTCWGNTPTNLGEWVAGGSRRHVA